MKMLFIMNVSVLLLLIFPSIISEVIDFSTPMCSQFFSRGQPPVIPGILENSRSMNNRYKTICQKYGNDYRFATLYDTTNRIPVFSAYRFIGDMINRPQKKWKIEPQLELFTDEMSVPYANQATDEDYTGNKIDRGHLFPSCYSGDDATARSTFTLTNIVPQKNSFNKGSWSHMEMKTKDLMRNYCRDESDLKKVLAHVLTGAVPNKANNQLNNRVNIPSHMWMTFCCYNSTSSSWSSQAYWGANEDKNKNNKVSEGSLEELQGFLSREWVSVTQLFYNDCKERNKDRIVTGIRNRNGKIYSSISRKVDYYFKIFFRI